MASALRGAAWSRYSLLIAFQALLIVLFAVFVRYDDSDQTPPADKVSPSLYAMFQDVHVMIFIGFGFLMTFLRKYGYSALGFNWLIGALVIQWALLCQNFYNMQDGHIYITLKALVEADIMAAAVLISFGALLGRTTGPQLMTMAIIETAVGCTNLYILNDHLKISDVGGSIGIHTFGAYFGLAASLTMRTKSAVQDRSTQQVSLEGPSYSSDITAMIGSVFLWIFWPSFNAALVSDSDGQYRAVVNTYLALAAATLTAFVLSSMVNSERKFDMVHVQNSTLSGGVAVGSVCNMYVHPFGALAIGTAAGALSVIGYRYLTPKLDSGVGLRDTCGVHNLHGMPGVLSGLLSAIFASLATTTLYNNKLYEVFTPMDPAAGDRSAQTQAVYQLLGLVVTLVIALVSGAITGLVLRSGVFSKVPVSQQFDDCVSWELPDADLSEETHELADSHAEK